MLRLYLDESGSKDDPALSVVSIGGFLGPIDAWGRFEQGWKPVLKKFNISELHMQDFTQFRKDFEGWSEHKRRTLLASFFEVLERERGVLIPIGDVRPVQDYRDGSFPPSEGETLTEYELRQLLAEDPIVASFREVIHLASTTLPFHWSANEKIQTIFDNRADKHRIIAAYDFILQWHPELTSRIAFDSSIDLVALQSADFVAYELAKHRGDPTHQRYTFQRLQALNPVFSGL